jgi:hypothetical protein
MFDSKKLAATPITELPIGSDDFCVAVACKVDQGENETQLCRLLNIQLIELRQHMNHGRVLNPNNVLDLFSEASMARYEKGRKCLVLNHPQLQYLIGREVFLGDPSNPNAVTNNENLKRYWRTDPVILHPKLGEFAVVFQEPWLLPIDDEQLNDELRLEELPVVKGKEHGNAEV